MLFKRIAAFLLALLLIFSPMCMRTAYAAEVTNNYEYEEVVEINEPELEEILEQTVQEEEEEIQAEEIIEQQEVQEEIEESHDEEEVIQEEKEEEIDFAEMLEIYEETHEANITQLEEPIYEELIDIVEDDWGSIDPELFDRKVYVDFLNMPSYYGEEVALVAVLVDFRSDDHPTFQWQYSFDSENWEVLTGETSQVYKFTVTPDNAGLYYRVVVKI